eukprot:Skav210491  [mRNA]  locus=scaffold737:952629:954230:- [translate_table: standard]
MVGRMEDFQRNTAFVAFLTIVCFGISVYIARNLRDTIAPLCWAAFFAVPSTLLISYIDRLINRVMSFLKRSLKACFHLPSDMELPEPESVRFTATGCRIRLDSPKGEHFLHKVNRPCTTSPSINRFLRVLRLDSCCRRRVCIAELERDGCSNGSEGSLVKDWTYYLCQKADASCELFLDSAEEYPAVFPKSSGTRLRGKLVIDKSSSLSWLVSLILTLAIMAAAVSLFVLFIQLGVKSFTSNLNSYVTGVTDFLELIKPLFPSGVWDNLQKKVNNFLEQQLPPLVGELLTSIEALSFQALMFLVYLSFWIFEPLPISSPVAEVFKSYLLLKTIVCLMFAALMSLLLLCLQCKIWSLFFVLTFLLNFIPEIGAIASAILTVPAVLFDGHLPREQRVENLLWLVICGTGIKIFTGNVVEVQMYANLGGQFMRMHPVIIMALIMLFSALLGVTGMFLAVPAMAAVKYYLVSTDIPKEFKNPLLVFIEGDATAGHKNFVEQQRLMEQHHGVEEQHVPSGSVESIELGEMDSASNLNR